MIKATIQTDEILYKAICKGSYSAFDSLFIRYYPKLCAYAAQFVDMEDAEEIVQDIMLWLWENRKNATVDTSVQNYLFRSVRNKCITLINRNKVKQKRDNILQAEMLGTFNDPDFYIFEELKQRLKTAISALPESYKVAFEMNRFQNMTYKDIALKLNVSPKTVDYRIQQALKLLREELKEYLPLALLLYLN
ncbi:RNA polymerase sigma-70 factor [Arcticibacter tournemirensis]|uniref:RNA polymerase sigma-70 factor n=1 Tax=Arcticibacter tournemirensis TaxID=699437 RepID=A0A5M9HDP7_9SPHI|nr:RNA polymerase sigma-70 factor [Arcticibacter tournemirensis]